MIEKIGPVKNPLTIIAIFADIAEVSGTIVLPFLTANNQSVFLWFLILFPSILVLLFFLTLNFNHTVLYAPSDYSDGSEFRKVEAQVKNRTTNDVGDLIKPSAEKSVTLSKND